MNDELREHIINLLLEPYEEEEKPQIEN